MINNKRNKQQETNDKKRACYFCLNGLRDVDYKDIRVLQKLISGYAKILPTKKTGICAKHQRKLATAIKRARFMALIPYTTR